MIYVDYPSYEGDEFIPIEQFKTKRAAIAFLRELWGEHNVTDDGYLLVVTGEDESNDRLEPTA
jgi:predicted ATP-grasp superfamily ATP-dependent carboligase